MDKPSGFFWSNGYAWGTCQQEPTEGGIEAKLTVLRGSLTIRWLMLREKSFVEIDPPRTIAQGEAATF